MAEKRECKLYSSKNNSPPGIKNSPQPVAQHVTPSTSFTPLKKYHELCVADENLPSKDIAQLWQRPLKLSNSQTYSNPASPNSQNIRQRIKNQPTPTRRSVLPPTKLIFDHGNSDEKPSNVSRIGYRRSMSFPERGGCMETPIYNPKRLKLINDENSPYEELINSNKSTLKEFNKNAQSSSTLTPAVKKLFLKSQSDSILSSTCIKTALEKIERDPNLIGDASTSYMLPVKKDGKHPDLKEITIDTLANLLHTKEDCNPGVTFKIIDCRYPYEFDGGHIRGALNMYTKTHILEQLIECKTALNNSGKQKFQKENNIREILIFHCEFSSRRGPFLCRYLRDVDRSSNASTYPFLFYPELYVLYGGYKDFFEKYPKLCDPSVYVPMSHPAHADKYRRYKSQSKLGFGA